MPIIFRFLLYTILVYFSRGVFKFFLKFGKIPNFSRLFLPDSGVLLSLFPFGTEFPFLLYRLFYEFFRFGYSQRVAPLVLRVTGVPLDPVDRYGMFFQKQQ